MKNDDINKTVLSFRCIFEIGKRWGGKNINDRIDTEIKGKYNFKKWMNLQNNKLENTK